VSGTTSICKEAGGATVSQRTLIRGGHVLSQDDAVGEIANCDVLITDGVITAVGPDLAGGGSIDAEVLDATGMIVLPGFVDSHRHTWQTTIRGCLPCCTLDGYLGEVIARVGPAYQPEDVHAGNLLGALEALNAGITTLLDWSHANNTPEHADAGVHALRESGIRAVYAYGPPAAGDYWGVSPHPHPRDACRVREQYFATDDQLLTFALALRGPGMCTPDVVAHDWALARELDARITVHAGQRVTGFKTEMVAELHRAGLLGPDTTYVHCNDTTEEEWKLIADSGGTISLSPYVEMLMGHGYPPYGRALAHGLRPSLSVDVVTSVPGDMFTQMRTALAAERALFAGDDHDIAFAPTLTHRDVLRAATIDGAAACGLDHRTGSLTPGKDADIVLLRADRINTFPVVDAAATVVVSADTSNIDTVLVRGTVQKRDGVLRADVRGAMAHGLQAADRVQTAIARSHVLATNGAPAT
jgi:cytosine/adenosine deaminase-related metal-dependent hydrolase